MKLNPIVLLCAPLMLTACSDKQTAQLQQAASAAIGTVHQQVDSASAPLGDLQKQAGQALGQLKQQASAASGMAQKVGEAAAILNPELKAQVDKVKQAAQMLQASGAK